MKNEERKKMVDAISTTILLEVIFAEKKNSNSEEIKDSDMIKNVKKIVEREVKKYDIQKNENN